MKIVLGLVALVVAVVLYRVLSWLAPIAVVGVLALVVWGVLAKSAAKRKAQSTGSPGGEAP
ncbi:hypothetical protein [Ottowia sp.]|uniref:hypothetical protein n=1 Tax=Ottowia sp. TaxID=1898956 RepID=UPI0025F47F82|nr:hypothetical protein [Ottowia sp.]MBK6616265.1 hypothetical protein [Ottowia sp.]